MTDQARKSTSERANRGPGWVVGGGGEVEGETVYGMRECCVEWYARVVWSAKMLMKWWVRVRVRVCPRLGLGFGFGLGLGLLFAQKLG